MLRWLRRSAHPTPLQHTYRRGLYYHYQLRTFINVKLLDIAAHGSEDDLWAELCQVDPKQITSEACNVLMETVGPKNLSLVQRVFDWASQHGVVHDVRGWQLLVTAHCAQRPLSVSAVIQRMEEMRRAGVWGNTKLYNHVAEALGRAGFHRQVLQIVRDMRSAAIPPDHRTLDAVLQSLLRLGDTNTMLRTWKEMLDAGVVPSTKSFGILIDQVGKQGLVDKALELHRQMATMGVPRSTATYNSLIKALGQSGALHLMREILAEMLNEGCTPNEITFTTIVRAFTSTGDMESAITLFKSLGHEFIQEGMIHNVLIKAHLERGERKEALALFDEMKKSGIPITIVTYNTFLTHVDTVKAAVKLIDVIKESELEPNERTYTILLDKFAKNGRIESMEELMNNLRDNGFALDVTHYTPLLDAYGRKQDLVKLTEVWQRMKDEKVTPNHVSFTIMINAFAKAGDLEQAMRFYADMNRHNIPPTAHTYATLLHALQSAGKIDQMLALFEQIRGRPHLLSQPAFNIVILGLGKSGRVEEMMNILDILYAVGFQPGQAIFNTLLFQLHHNKQHERIVDLCANMLEHQVALSAQTPIRVRMLLGTEESKERVTAIFSQMKELGLLLDTPFWTKPSG